MKLTLQDRLLRRELGDTSRYSKIRGMYGDKYWVDELDIVNELGGHTGCVNALSWSKSGRLLASGSDDMHLNIHTYQPDSYTAPFTLTTSVSTGHRANIFSVKFMPHSNDRTLITAAGDHEVRIFDIEYSGRSSIPSAASALGTGNSSREYDRVYNGVRYLTDGDTNCRVFRSHSDRVKRIVTESSPFLFLTCSEDGEVRQWDIRQPSSAYPSPRHPPGDNSHVPPPLISYKRYGLDLNTISCSPSQPHYIALGGAHLHCFLHDRRMTGRDILAERGQLPSRSSSASISGPDEELMGQATRCVRRFAPNGKKKMRRTDSGHITACKISDANPNELIASWSGDLIYSFDIVQSPDAPDAEDQDASGVTKGKGKGRVRETGDKKRKRGKTGSSSSLEVSGRAGSKQRQEGPLSEADDELAIRVRYGNGQSEDIPMEQPRTGARDLQTTMSQARWALLSESERRSYRIAQAIVKLRKGIFSPSERVAGTNDASPAASGVTPVGIGRSFDEVLGYAATYLPQMDEIMRTWRYPIDPAEEVVILQRALRQHRESAWRFVQAAGVLSRVLGGRLRTAGPGDSPALQQFILIVPAPNEGRNIDERSQFCYDFLKAILLWLEGGPEALLQGFKRPPDQRNDSPRFPIPEDARYSALSDILIPYLLRMSTAQSIPNVDASRFERDEYRMTFETETAAVVAFANAIRIPLRDVEGALETASAETVPSAISGIAAQDKRAALRFWGFRIGRGLLMNAGEGVNFAFVDRAFGGLGNQDPTETERSQEDIDPNEEELVVEHAEVVRREQGAAAGAEMPNTRSASGQDGSAIADPPPAYSPPRPTVESEDDSNEDELVIMDDLHDVLADDDEDEQELEEEGDDDDDDSDEDDSDAEAAQEARQFVWSSSMGNSRWREKVEADVPCSSHTRAYRGHCNYKTVKDVYFYGLQDEYVVSGSDSGHLFIWDRKTTQLLNILEADSEVVNVVQGHPYEPMLAVSGIDHTIKIFSPDQRAQEDARNGINIANNGTSGFSSLELGITRLGRRRPPRGPTRNGPDADTNVPANGLTSRKRMDQSYEITSRNDVERLGRAREAYITRGMLEHLVEAMRRGDVGAQQQLAEGDTCQIM